MSKFFYNYKELKSFANSVKFHRVEDLNEKTRYDFRRAEEDLAAFKPLVIDGFTELVTIYEVREQKKNFSDELEFWFLERIFVCLKNVETGRLYDVRKERDGKFVLYTSYVYYDWARGQRLKNFKTDAVAPNRIGVANRKKMQAWFDYLDGIEKQKDGYIAESESNRLEFLKKLEGLDVNWEKEGWSGKIWMGDFVYKFEIYENGKGVYEKWEVAYSADNKLETFLKYAMMK